MGFGVREFFPGEPGVTRFLGHRHFRGGPQNDGRGLQRLCGAQDAFPNLVGRGDGQVNALALVFGQGERPREEILFRGAEKLFRHQSALAGSGALQDADVQNHHVLPGGIDAPEDGGEVVKGVVVAHQNQNVIRPNSHGLGCEFFSRDEMKLVELLVNALARAGHLSRKS